MRIGFISLLLLIAGCGGNAPAAPASPPPREVPEACRDANVPGSMMSAFAELDGAMVLDLDPLADNGCVRDGCWELTAQTLGESVEAVQAFCEENCGWKMEPRRLLPATHDRCAQAIFRLSLQSYDSGRTLGGAWLAAEVDASSPCSGTGDELSCAFRRIPLEPTDPRVTSDPGWPDLDGDGHGERLEIERPGGRGHCSLPTEEGAEAQTAWFPRNVTVTVRGTRGERLAGPIVLEGVPDFEPPPGRDPESEAPLPPCSGFVSGPWNRRELVGEVLLRSLDPNPGFEVVFAAMRSTCRGPCGVGESTRCECDVEATYVEFHQFAHGAPQDVRQQRVDDDAGVLRVRADCGEDCRVLAVPGVSFESFEPGPGPHRSEWRAFDGELEDVMEETSDGRSGVRLPPGRHVVWVFDGGRDPIAFEVSAPQDDDDLTLDTRGAR